MGLVNGVGVVIATLCHGLDSTHGYMSNVTLGITVVVCGLLSLVITSEPPLNGEYSLNYHISKAAYLKLCQSEP